MEPAAGVVDAAGVDRSSMRSIPKLTRRQRRRLCPLFGEAATPMKARAMRIVRGWGQPVRWRLRTAALMLGAALLARPALAADTDSAVAAPPVKPATCAG